MTRIPAWLTTQRIAHRGLHDGAAGIPENSLAAFNAAADCGYAIELDLRPAADTEPMVFHDHRLERLTGRTGALKDLPSDALRQITLTGSDQRIPTLATVLASIAGRVPILIEIKGMDPGVGVFESRVAGLLEAYDGAVAVQSFNPHSMGWFADHAGALIRGQVATDAFTYTEERASLFKRILLGRLLLNRVSRPDFIAYNVKKLPRPAPLAARRRGLPLLAWTVRDAADLAVADAYADNIIFEGFRPP